MLNKIITCSFYTLFAVTPLIWYPANYELFEFNKMIFVYLLTTIITGAWALKSINNKQLTINKTPLDIPILLFLASQILSTAFSIDPHTSLFGYYSRSNGGLLSIISYLLLFYAFVSNVQKQEALKMLKFMLYGGLAVALYAIPEHFGISPSCVILRGDLTASCWVQDVQARVFATLGQPNWLAGYLGMLIFPAIYFFLTAKNKRQLVTSYLLLVTSYLAFTFAYSRGAMLGLLAGLAVFILLLFLSSPRMRGSNYKVDLLKWIPAFAGMTKSVLIILVTLFIINLFYGSALTRFQLTQLLPQSTQNQQPTTRNPQTTNITQLENGGTESGAIRLIVWQGALDIFKHYPIFGSGVETFAYSYYQFRPQAHNLVSEWDFLYNKAHNEFLNYLATTGILGFSSYSIMIIAFIIFILKKQRYKNLLLLSLLSSYIFYLVQNFFGFSVVIIALLFYLLPAFAFVISENTKPLILNSKFLILNSIYRRPFYTKLAQLLIFITLTSLLITVIKMWLSDTYFASGEKYSNAGNPGQAYNLLSMATALNPNEPFYINELGYAAAGASVSLKDTDATLSAELQEEAVKETEDSLKTSPNNTSFWRTAIRTYYLLTDLDQKYYEKTLNALDKAITLAPTDPKLYYNKALILGQLDRDKEAIEVLQKTIALKNNYKEGYYSLALFQFDQQDYTSAIENMNKIFQIIPADPDSTAKLVEWGKQGIATESAK